MFCLAALTAKSELYIPFCFQMRFWKKKISSRRYIPNVICFSRFPEKSLKEWLQWSLTVSL